MEGAPQAATRGPWPALRRVPLAAIFWALALALAAYYFVVLTSGHVDPFKPVPLGMIFNSMAEHLARGSFETDLEVLEFEAFVRDGRAYSYFGIFLAAIRLPLLLFPGGIATDVTVLSCALASSAMLLLKLRTLQHVFDHLGRTREAAFACALLGTALALSGAQVQFLRISPYQEVISWSGVMAAGFCLLAVRGLLEGRFPAARLAGMAVMAGIALNTRVSMGIGLFAALVLLMATLALRDFREGGLCAVARRAAAPVAVLAVFVLVAGVVNHGRWGNPFTFADYTLYVTNFRPERAHKMARQAEYGLFNLQRLPFGLSYYFLPVWSLLGSDGRYMFQDWHMRVMNEVELPPMSFFLTDPLLIALAGIAVAAALRKGSALPSSLLHASAVLVGLSSAAFLMLIAESMCLRYRMEFYPPLEVAAFLGLVVLVRRAEAAPPTLRRRASLVAATAVGIAGSHLAMALYKVSGMGTALQVAPDGVVAYYGQMLSRLP